MPSTRRVETQSYKRFCVASIGEGAPRRTPAKLSKLTSRRCASRATALRTWIAYSELYPSASRAIVLRGEGMRVGKHYVRSQRSR